MSLGCDERKAVGGLRGMRERERERERDGRVKEEAECMHGSDDDDDDLRSPLNTAYYYDFGETQR